MSESRNGSSFETLLVAELPKLKAVAQKQFHSKGKLLFSEGDVGDGMYLIEEGAVEIAAALGNGQRRLLTILRAGAVFGEMAVIDGERRSAMAVAHEDTSVYFIPAADALCLFEQSPALLVAMARAFSRRQREMTHHYVAEALEAERLSLVGRFAQSIIHDLKNPLGIVALAAEVGMGEDTPMEDRKEARTLHDKALTRLSVMVHELLEFTQGSRRDLPHVPTNYRTFVDQIVEEVRAEAAERGVEVVCEDSAPDAMLLIEPQRLSHVFYNLVHNAIDFMPNGGRIALRFAEMPGKVVTEVEDSGPGIAPEIAAHVFEPFATHGKQHGTGLGLSICKRIIEDHDGQISARSEPGHGAVFVFVLPRPADQAA